MLWLHMIIGKLHWFPDQIITKLYVHGMTRVSPSFSVIAAAAADCVNTYTYRDFLKESNQVYTNIYTKWVPERLYIMFIYEFWCFLKVVNGFFCFCFRHRSDRGWFVTYLNLLLKVFNVLNSQVQHVCRVCLLQIDRGKQHWYMRPPPLTHKRWLVWLCATSQNVTLSMFGTRSCSFLILSLILVLLTWRAVHTDYYLKLVQLCLGICNQTQT